MSIFEDPDVPLRGLSSRQMASYRFRRNPLALIGAFIVFSVVFAAIFAPLLVPLPRVLALSSIFETDTPPPVGIIRWGQTM